MNLDNTDVNILKVLLENGRLSFRQIAERIKVSVPTVSSKVGNLENMGVIKGYTANIDTEKLGGISVIITLKTKPADLRRVSERFLNSERVRQMYAMSNGKLQLVCTFSSQAMINEFITSLADVPEIIEYEIANIVSVMKEGPRAVVNGDTSVVLQCSYCKKQMHDDAVKVRLGERDYYVCCPVCQKGFEAKYNSMKAEAEKAKAES
ncbi:MAG: HTH-type transcriptional regulator LrpA [Methanomassiliicoccales archaeon PtaU1.Bin124]|nr:MAG: HTH-type transcriptional regulator LrpA [Methanomassiliicoccales archaeon PtaU1.Bin124]